MIFSSLNERRREMAILRAIGANPRTILGLFILETTIMATGGVILGAILLYGVLAGIQTWIDNAFGLWIPLDPPTVREGLILCGVIGVAMVASLLPALRAYRLSIADGNIVRV